MAGPEDFFSPGEWFDPNQLAVPPAVQRGFEDPRLRAAATQFGLNLLGGGGWGGSFSSDLARGIGAAGEAVGRGEAMDTKQTELDIRRKEAGSRAETRHAQAEAATSRAQTAQGQLQLAQEKAAFNSQLEQQKVEQNQERINGLLRLQDEKIAQAKDETERKRLRDERENIIREGKLAEGRIRTQSRLDMADESRKKNRTSQIIALQGLYQRDPGVTAALKFNNDIVNRGQPPQPVPTFQEWLAKNQHLWSSDLFPDIPRGGTISPDTTTPPITSPSTSTSTPTSKKSPAAPIRVNTPEEAAKLAPGTKYITPDGQVFTR